MKPEQTAAFAQQLTGLRTALLDQIAAQRGGDISRAEAASDHFSHTQDSQAQVATERELEFAIGEREIVELGAIDSALQRIAAGTYGQCADCDVKIPVARLQATPEAPRCIHCQEKFEQLHPV